MNCIDCGKRLDVLLLNAKIVSSGRRSTSWTKQEDDMIRFTADLDLKETAAMFDRTSEAIRKRREYLRHNTPKYDDVYVPRCPYCGALPDPKKIILEAAKIRGRIMTEERLKAIRKMIGNR